jgi:hypothetical protein
MTSTSLGALIGLAAALTVASQLGGSVGAGVLLGSLVGLAVSLAFARLQRAALARAPRQLPALVAASLLAKFVLVVGGTLLLRFVDAASARWDWRAYGVSFAASVLLVSAPATLGAIRNARLVKESRAL